MWSPEESDLFGVSLFYGRFLRGVLKEGVFFRWFLMVKVVVNRW
jgi:hypothetical protein